MRNVTKKASSRRMLTVDVGDLKEPWDRYCLSSGAGSSSDVLRQVIRKLAHREIKDAGLDEPVERVEVYQVEPVPVKRMDRGMEIRFTESEREAVRERSRADGFASANQWVVALVRANLTSTPQFGKEEILALGESNHQLLAIGRNLNQIAKSMNSVKGGRDEYDRVLVEELAKAVQSHVKKVGNALRASIFRWKLTK